MSLPFHAEVQMETQRLAVLASNALEDAMDLAQLTRTQLASKAEVSKPRVTHVLTGGGNVTLETMARFGLACGVRWEFVGVDAEDQRRVLIAPTTLGLQTPKVYSLAADSSSVERHVAGDDDPASPDETGFTALAA